MQSIVDIMNIGHIIARYLGRVLQGTLIQLGEEAGKALLPQA